MLRQSATTAARSAGCAPSPGTVGRGDRRWRPGGSGTPGRGPPGRVGGTTGEGPPRRRPGPSPRSSGRRRPRLPPRIPGPAARRRRGALRGGSVRRCRREGGRCGAAAGPAQQQLERYGGAGWAVGQPRPCPGLREESGAVGDGASVVPPVPPCVWVGLDARRAGCAPWRGRERDFTPRLHRAAELTSAVAAGMLLLLLVCILLLLPRPLVSPSFLIATLRGIPPLLPTEGLDGDKKKEEEEGACGAVPVESEYRGRVAALGWSRRSPPRSRGDALARLPPS